MQIRRRLKWAFDGEAMILMFQEDFVLSLIDAFYNFSRTQ